MSTLLYGMTSNSFQKVQKIDPFNDPALGDWKPSKKHTNKNYLAFERQAEINIPERYAQDWIDPVSQGKKKIWGLTFLAEVKLISKKDGTETLQRRMEPCMKGSTVIDKL